MPFTSGFAASRASAGSIGLADFQRRLCHDAAQPRFRDRQLCHPVGLRLRLLGVAFALHKNEFGHRHLTAGPAIVFDPVTPIQRRHTRQPGVAESFGVAQMHVRIDEREGRNGPGFSVSRG